MTLAKKKVLHIVAWYPHKGNTLDGVWIYRHIKSLKPYCINSVLHIQVNPSGRFRLYRNNESDLRQIIVDIPFKSWRVAEILTTLLVVFALKLTSFGRKIDLINVHIAYPLLIHYHLWKRIVPNPLVVTEHWSGYHFNFGIKDDKALRRIRRIFFQEIPVIAVSHALLRDIVKFSGNQSIQGYVTPNVVNAEIFTKKKDVVDSAGRRRFFMVSYWKWPKDPFTLIEAFRELVASRPQCVLRLGGHGPQMEQILHTIEKYSLTHQVILLGPLDSHAISAELNEADAFLHSSAYETFSVVTAEALSCGTPVIVTAKGGIRELVHSGNGVLVEENTVTCWLDAFQRFELKTFDRDRISAEARGIFSEDGVGDKYWSVLKNELGQ